MANIKSAIKDIRKTAARTLYNSRMKRRVKTALKDAYVELNAGDDKKVAAKLPRVSKVLDKAVKKGILKKGTAARRKSRLAKKLNILAAQNVEAAAKNS